MAPDWHHAPPHRFSPGQVFIITAATLGRRAHFGAPERRDLLLEEIRLQATQRRWNLHAWAVLPNHHHIIAEAPDGDADLTALIRAVHSRTAKAINRLDEAAGRKVWHQFWDTLLTSEPSYLARLKYVNENPVKHGLVERAEDYPWCSMREFLRDAPKSFQRTVLQMGTERVRVPDAF